MAKKKKNKSGSNNSNNPNPNANTGAGTSQQSKKAAAAAKKAAEKAKKEMEKLINLADKVAINLDIALSVQETITQEIQKGTIKSVEELSQRVAALSNKDLAEVSSRVDDINEKFKTSASNTKKLSDNILSSKGRLEQLLKTSDSYRQQTYKLQRRALMSEKLTLDQRREALKISEKVLKSKGDQLKQNELLLKVLKNAGKISEGGFEFIEDSLYGKLKEAQKQVRGLATELAEVTKESTGANTKLAEMQTNMKKYVSRLGYRGRLLKQRDAIKKDPKLTKAQKTTKLKDVATKISAVENELAKYGHKSFKSFKDAVDKAKKSADDLKDKQTDLNNKLDAARALYLAEQSAIDDTATTIKKLLDKRMKLSSVSTSINAKAKILLELMEDATEVNVDQVNLYKEQLEVLKEQQRVTGEQTGAEYNNFRVRASFLVKAHEIHKQTQATIRRQFETLSQMSSFIPGIGTKLSKAFTEAGQKVSDLAFNMYQAFATTFSQTGNGIKSLGASLKVALSNPATAFMLAMAAAGAALAAIISQVARIGRDLENVARNTGLTVDQALLLERQAMRVQIRFDNVLSSLKDIREAQAGIIQDTGIFLRSNNAVLNTVSNIGKAFSYGSKMAGQLHTELLQVSGGSEVLAANTQVAIAKIAEAEGLAPGLLPKQILENSETVAKYFTGYPKQLAKTVIQINKMGLGLAQLESMMTHLLDYEKSITAEFEASVAIGRHVNVGRARDLLLQEDMLGAMQAMREEAGSLAEFEAMGFARRKLMANAMGLSVKETRKMLFISEQMNGENEKLKQTSLDNYELIQKLTGGNDKLFKVQAKNVQATQKFNVAVQKIGMAFKMAILPMVEALLPLISLLASGVSLIAKTIQGMLAPITLLASALSDVGSYLSGGPGGATKNALQSLAPTKEEDGNGWASGAKILGMAVGAIGTIVGGAKMIKGIRKNGVRGSLSNLTPGGGGRRGSSPSNRSYVSALVENIGGALGGVGRRGRNAARSARNAAGRVGRATQSKFGQFISFIKNGFKGILGFFSRSLSKMATLMTSGASALASGAKSMASGAKSMAGRAASSVAGGASKAASSVSGGLSRAASSVASGASRAASSVAGGGSRAIQGVKNFGAKVLGGAKNIGGRVLSGAKNLGQGAINLGGKALSAVGAPVKKVMQKLVAWISKNGLKFLKGGGIAALLEALMFKRDVKGLVKNATDKDTLYQEVGERAFSGLGGLLGGALGGVAGTAIPIPGFGTFLGSVGGQFAGNFIGKQIAKAFGARKMGKFVLDEIVPGVKKHAPIPLATGGIVTGPTHALVGEAGTEAVVPLDEFYGKLDELIVAVKGGGGSDSLSAAINNLTKELQYSRNNPVPAILEDSTARELNKKLKSYNG